ncbi:MAG: J domain-containing protein [Leptolyngbyaceae bacterium]|nr:J domain-containing protein [Leptolyngbyaceae bacterium]
MGSMHFDIHVGKSYVNTPRPQVAEIIADINHRIHQPNYAKVGGGITVAIALMAVVLSYEWLGLLILICGGIGCGTLAYYRRRDRFTTLNYRCDHDIQLRFVTIQKACQMLAQSEKIWMEAACKPVTNKSQNAGASQVISLSKTPVKVICVSPPFIQTNIKVWAIDAGFLSLFFLPDYILLWRRQLYSAMSYSALKIGCDRQQINIAGDLPSDAKILGQTWQHLTADGKPQPGLRGNQKLFKVQYGLLRVMATIGINLRFYVSNVDQAEQFTQSFCSVQQWLSPRQPWEQRQTSPKSSGETDYGVSHNRPAHEILGVNPNASLDDIRAAYHRVARMNHPDKMIGLAPEFRQLAEQRMKVITAAYKTLSQRSRQESMQNGRS